MRERARRFVLRVAARRVATARAAVGAWRRRSARPVVPLDDVRRRVELLLAALYGRTVRVEAAEVPKPPALERLAAGTRRAWRALRGGDGDERVGATTLPLLDGDCVRLPHALDAADGREAAVARFRLLAIEQAERLARDTAVHLPSDDPLALDLYLVTEGAAVDRAVSQRAPGVGAALATARRAALETRPDPATLAGTALVVERLVRRALGAPEGEHDGSPLDPIVHAAAAELAIDRTPEAARAWAYDLADRLRAAMRTAHAHGAMRPVPFWGAAPIAPPVATTTGEPLLAEPAPPRQWNPIEVRLQSRRAREAGEGEEDTRAGVTTRHATGPAGPEDERGAERVVDDDGGSPTGEPAERGRTGAGVAAAGIAYPEWDHAAHQYRRDAVLVRELAPETGSGAWADGVLSTHAALVRRVRARFESLRAQRMRLGRQPRGDEIDLAAYVDGHAARLAGRGDADERLYVAIRPARRALAILVLVDVSGSTDARVDGERQVIDVEKEAVLLASAALEALGDAYAVLAFSSRGARDVRVTTLKGFAERDAALLRRRVEAVRPGANTRLGAALRHATALLARQPAGHRLLLLLSDGRPNDSDGYQGEYAVEDARQAVHEARAQGVTPFCLTVDREAPEYLAHVFGVTGRTVLRRPEQLPLALVGVVRQLLGAGRV